MSSVHRYVCIMRIYNWQLANHWLSLPKHICNEGYFGMRCQVSIKGTYDIYCIYHLDSITILLMRRLMENLCLIYQVDKQ